MPDRTSKPDHPLKPPKRPRDFNSRAFQIVGELTGTLPKQPEEPDDPMKAAAAILGRRGGLKGGRARAEKLSAERRKTIAQDAARQRWSKRP
jgi:hypothetical protein